MTTTEARDLIRNEYSNDWRLPIVGGLVHIKTKDMRLIPLKLNTVQRRLMMKIWKLQQAGKPVRLLIPKARQHGISTFTEAMIYCITAFQPNTNAIIIADDKTKARGIFEMSKLIHRKMNETIRTEIAKSNATELVFAENESKIVVAVDARSGTFHLFHSSETAFYRHAEETMLGALQTVPDAPGTMVIMESTGNGVMNYFHRAVLDALAGRSEYEVFFIPWFDNPDYQTRAPKGFQPTVSAEYGDEIALKEQFNLTNAQLYWRRRAISNTCGGDIHKFMQEYPATIDECFQGSGYPVFDHEKLSEMDKKGSAHPTWTGWFDGEDLHITPGGRGYVKVWDKPVEERWLHRYVIGADTGGTYEGADYSCAYAYDRVTKRVAAMIHGHFDAYEYAKHLVMLGTWYQTARLAIEINIWASETDEMGQTVIDKIKTELKYRNLYTRKVTNKIDKTETMEVGWHTNHETKQMLVDRLRYLINNWETEPIAFQDAGFIEESKTYIVDRTKTGITTWNAAEGCKDDRVMSMGITLCVAGKMPKPRRYNPDDFKQESTDNIMESIAG